MEKIRHLQTWMSDNINTAYRIFLLSLFALSAVFFTSRMWLPSDVKIQNSDIGTTRTTTSGTEITLESWQYNPSDHFMEAAFSYQNSSDTQDIQFISVAHTNTSKAVKMDTSIPYSNNGLLVVQFRNVPQNWNAISLWIDSKDSRTAHLPLDTDSASGFAESRGSADNGMEDHGANFFCDTRKVVRNSSLKSQTTLYYSLKAVDSEISKVQSQITQANKKITAAKLSIQQLTSDISALKGDQKYQTADEIRQSNSAIQSKTAQISNLKNGMEQYNLDIKTYQQKLQKLKQKWSDMKNGTYQSVSSSGTDSVGSLPPSSSSAAAASPRQTITVD
jgi:hypothetical protein